MTPVMWGLVGAVAFGAGDFVARIVGRELGALVVTTGMLVVGTLAFWSWILVAGLPIVFDPNSFALLVPAGILIMVGSLLFYAALSRGPVSVVAPLSGTFPIWVIIIGLFLGIVPSIEQFVAMAVVMVGVAMVTAFSDPQGDDMVGSGGIGPTVLMTVAVTMIFGAVIYLARDASVVVGEVQATAWMRAISLVAMVLFLALRRAPLRAVPKWWPALIVVGVCDTGAFFALLVGSRAEGAPLAAVAMSAYAVITVVLARIFLKENVPLRQWTGIVVVVAGVASLAYFS